LHPHRIGLLVNPNGFNARDFHAVSCFCLFG
jgi:hypothetical protein